MGRQLALSEVSDFFSGGTPSKSNSEFWGGEIPWVSAKDMKNSFLSDSEDHVTNEGARSGTRLLPTGSTLILVRGMTLHNYVPICFAERPLTINQDVKGLIPKNEIRPKFLYYSLKAKHDEIHQKVDSAGHGTGRLNSDQLKSIKIEVPSLELQDLILSQISPLDDKIELNRKINQTMEQMARAIFRSWFINFDPVHANAARKRPFWIDDATAALFPDSFAMSELGKIPKGWTVTDVGNATELIIDHRGKTPLKLGGNWSDSGHPAVSAKNIKSNRLVQMDNRFVDEDLYLRWMKDPLRYGDILLTSEAPLGEMYFVTTDTSYVLSQRVYGIRANHNEFTPEYLFLWLDSPRTRKDMEDRATGSTVVGIRQSELRKVKVLSVPKKIQNALSLTVKPLLQLVAQNERESVDLAKTRDLLLPRLLSGEITIKGMS